MKAYCINLERRPDRWAHISAEAAQAGMELERIAAVDGLWPDVAQAAAEVGVGSSGLKMSSGAFACFQSHRVAWQRLVDSGAAHAMVLEDDLVLAPGLGTLLAGGWVPEDADVVKLETWGNRVHVAREVAADVGGRLVVRLLSSHIGAGCYVLSAGTAARLLAETGSFVDPVDELLFNDGLAFFRSAVIYQMVPAPAVQGKRPGGASSANWAASSITRRTVDPVGVVAPGRKSTAGRFYRRASAEFKSRRLGSRYEVISFG